MRIAMIAAALLIAACAPAEPEIHTTSVDVDDSHIVALMHAIDGLTQNELDVDALVALSESTPIDQEQQVRFDVDYRGRTSDMQIHIWREYQDWVHVYASSESADLIDSVETVMGGFARPSEAD